MTPTGLLARAAALCDAALGLELDDAAAAEVAAARAALDEPLRVAVVGRVKAGKSTLVNALIGRRVAPTDASECTRVVTWFRYGPGDRVEAVLRDGSTLPLRLEADGRLPEALPAPLPEVAALDVWLSEEPLRGMTLIDTPGLASANRELSRRTEALLGIDRDGGPAAAEAALFVFNPGPRADDIAVLRGFRAMSVGLDSSPVNAIGVLSKADRVDEGPDPWSVARRLAARHAATLRRDLATVKPVIGLLAETAETGGFTERDAAHLRTLAALDAGARARMLASADRFRAQPSEVPPDARERLLEHLDLHGVERLLEPAAAGASAVRMSEDMLAASGLPEVRRAIDAGFRRRAEALKADRALVALSRIADDPGREPTARARLRDGVEGVRLDPAMHVLAELDAYRMMAAGEVALAERLEDEVRRLVEGADPAAKLGVQEPTSPEALGRSALEGAQRWTAIANTSPDPRRAALARVMARSLHLLYRGAVEVGP